MEQAANGQGVGGLFVTRRLPIDVRAETPDDIPVRVFEGERPPTRAQLIEAARGSVAILSLVSDPIDGAVLPRALGRVGVALEQRLHPFDVEQPWTVRELVDHPRRHQRGDLRREQFVSHDGVSTVDNDP